MLLALALALVPLAREHQTVPETCSANDLTLLRLTGLLSGELETTFAASQATELLLWALLLLSRLGFPFQSVCVRLSGRVPGSLLHGVLDSFEKSRPQSPA